MKEKEEISPLTKALHIAAYPFSAAVGFLYAQTTIRDTMYNNLKKHGGFKEIRDEYEPSMKKLVGRTGPQALTVADEISSHHASYWTRATKRMSDMGFNNLGDFWNALHKNEQREIAATGVGVAVVMLGVILTALDSRELLMRAKRQEQDKATESPSAGKQ